MMKKILIGIALMVAGSTFAQSGLDQTATEIAAQMAPGWNLGNTLEGARTWAVTWENPQRPAVEVFTNDGGLESETVWQSTKTTQEVIDFVKSQGFRSIRIPCAWVWGHIADAENYTIDAAWMARVREIVDYCINDGLYVMLNDHYDGGWMENHIADNDEATKVKNREVLRAIWTQIATEFRDYDEHLLFAGMNEPNADTQAATNNLIEYEQVFIDAVRATGGNNEKRILIIQGPNTDVDKTCQYMNTLPKDIIEGKLAIEVHYYNPWPFCGMTTDEAWGRQAFYWGTANHVRGSNRNSSSNEAEMRAMLGKMKEKFVDKGYPVILGEYGANWREITDTGQSQEKHDASIRSYYHTLNELSREMGIVPMAWDTNQTSRPNTTIIDRNALTVFNQPAMDGIAKSVQPTSIKDLIHKSTAKDGIYTLSGIRIENPKKGLYIVNGRKVLFK